MLTQTQQEWASRQVGSEMIAEFTGTVDQLVETGEKQIKVEVRNGDDCIVHTADVPSHLSAEQFYNELHGQTATIAVFGVVASMQPIDTVVRFKVQDSDGRIGYKYDTPPKSEAEVEAEVAQAQEKESQAAETEALRRQLEEDTRSAEMRLMVREEARRMLIEEGVISG